MTTEAPLPEPLLDAVSQAIEAQLGLHFPRERWMDLERGLRAASRELRFASTADYAQSLTGSALDRPQADLLAAHLTVGETYFFRDPAAFDALVSQILPAIAEERRPGGKLLRIWSAGCCTGEEPYSLAIALRRALPDLADWQITILATDINPRFLHKAAAGVYSQWSFRGVPDETRDAWFRRTPEGRFEVLPAVRQMVTFACLNLVEDVYPSLATNTNAMDLIVCRNVLMYFSHEQLRKVAGNFRRSLTEGGRLVVSATEATREFYTDFSPADIPGISLFLRDAPRRATPPAPPPHEIVARPAPQPAPMPRPPVQRRPAPIAPAAPRPDHAEEARRLANAGSLGEALAASDRAIAADKLAPTHHYLRGVILQEQNALDESVAALKRALYLDPNFTIAHFALGHLMLRQGRARDAGRCFANARALLHGCAPESVVAESDGITAGRLLAILTSMQEAIA